MPQIHPTSLEKLRGNPQAALEMAVDMLQAIMIGNSFDSLDYYNRVRAIQAAQKVTIVSVRTPRVPEFDALGSGL